MTDAQPDPLELYKSQLDAVEQKLKRVSTTEETFKLLQEQKDKQLSDLIKKFEEEKAKLKAESYEFTVGLQKVNTKRQELNSKKEEALDNIHKHEAWLKAQEMNSLLNEKWEKMLMGVKWREWARDHQLDGAKQFAQQKRMILADEMGTGKTMTSIVALDFIRAATADARPDNPYEAEELKVQDWVNGGTKTELVNGVTRPCGIRTLYISPASLVLNVVEEFHMWAPHRSIIPLGSLPRAQRKYAMGLAAKQDNFVIVANYEAWRNDKTLIKDLIELDIDTVIIDEFHNAKDWTSDTYLGMKDIVNGAKIPFVMPMTGTPILNSPKDLYSILHLLFPNKFYSPAQYMREYCRLDAEFDPPKWTFKYGGIENISSFLGKRYLRRTKKDAGIKLPQLKPINHSISIDEDRYAAQAQARKTMRENAVLLLDEVDDEGDQKSITAAGALAVYTRLRQIETWPAGIVIKDKFGKEVERLDVRESQKLDYVLSPDGAEGLILDLLQSERVVLFSQFVPPLEILRDRLLMAGKRPALLTGSTPVHERSEISHDFDVKHRSSRPDGHRFDVALCHYRVGGVGLNLTEASQMIILDEEWNPGKRDQAYARINRLGQENEMTVHILHMEKTIDDWLSGIMEQKEGLVEGFTSGMGPSKDDFMKAIQSGLL